MQIIRVFPFCDHRSELVWLSLLFQWMQTAELHEFFFFGAFSCYQTPTEMTEAGLIVKCWKGKMDCIYICEILTL